MGYEAGYQQGYEAGVKAGREAAGKDVEEHLGHPWTNGGVRFDSDVEGPPEWLIKTAVRLARQGCKHPVPKKELDVMDQVAIEALLKVAGEWLQEAKRLETIAFHPDDIPALRRVSWQYRWAAHLLSLRASRMGEVS